MQLPQMPLKARPCAWRQHNSRLFSARCSPSQGSAARVTELDELLLKPGAAPQTFVGPVRVTDVEGCGRGVVAIRSVPAGELLLACVPLAVLTAPPGRLLQPSTLVKWLLNAAACGSNTPSSTAYQGLTPCGNQAPARKELTAEHIDLELLATLPGWDPTPSTASAQASGSSRVSAQPSRQALASACTKASLNAWVEPTQDVAAATVRKDKLVGITGVWPAMALINHSCAPNATVVLYSERQLVIRAATDIQEGDEVTITYAGPTAAAPIAIRRDYLRKGFNFTCQCSRCLIEQDYEEEPVGKAAQAFYRELNAKFRPRLLSYLDTDDATSAQALKARLVTGLRTMKAHLEEVNAVEDREVLESSYLPLCLELLSMCAMSTIPDIDDIASAKGRKQRQQLRQQHLAAAEQSLPLYKQRLSLLERVGPGSSALCQLAARASKLAHQARSNHDIAKIADTYARASKARYGVLTPDMHQRMLAAQEDNGLADALAAAAAAAQSQT